MSAWRTAWFCVDCEGRLTYTQKMYSNGRCPRCGYRDAGARTIVRTIERGYRLVRVAPWWQIWKPRRVEWRTP